MLDIAKQILLAQHPWSALIYLVVGVVAGAVAGTQYSLRAHRPRLLINGSGNGGTQDEQRWFLTILNQPSFVGRIVDGDAAREVRAMLQPTGKRQHPYGLYWADPGPEGSITLEPGQSRNLGMFTWQRGTIGFNVVDESNEPVARFQDSDHRFILQLRDRLGRVTKFTVRVQFDDTHLKNSPQLILRTPLPFATRLAMLRLGLRRVGSAFRR